MLKKICDESLKNLKKNGILSFMLCLIGVVSIGLIFSLSFVGYYYMTLTLLILFPLVVLPLVFALQCLHLGLRENVTPTGSLFFKFYRLYFSYNFRGVYHMIMSVLFAALLSSIVGSISGLIAYSCMSSDPAFAEDLKYILELYYANGSIEEFNKHLSSPAGYILQYAVVVPSTAAGLFILFLNSSFASFGVYFKVDNPSINPQASSRVYGLAKNMIRGKLIKEYWALNWPIFVLMFSGFAGGAAIAYFNDLTPVIGRGVSLLMGLAGMLIYMPFFMSNMESIYISHKSHFANAPKIYADRMQEVLSSQLDSLQKQMDDLNKSKANTPNPDDYNPNNQTSNNNFDSQNNDVIDADVKDDDTNHQ